jgi:hypothetical protein
VEGLAGVPQQAFPGYDKMKPKRVEAVRLKRNVIELKAERYIPKKLRPTGGFNT